MTKLEVFRSSMTKWNLFFSACIFAAGVLLKVGAPLVPVALGLSAAAFMQWRRRSRG